VTRLSLGMAEVSTSLSVKKLNFGKWMDMKTGIWLIAEGKV